MKTENQLPLTWPGLTLLVCLAAALGAAPAAGHEVHSAHEPHTAMDTTKADSEDDSRSVQVMQLLERFRAIGDDRDLDVAWSYIEPSLAAHPNDPRLLIEAAQIAQAQHRFDEALGFLDRVVRLSPYNDQAWLAISAIHLVTGNTDAASDACRALRRVPLLVTLTCRTRVAVAQGDAHTEAKLLKLVLDASTGETANRDWLAWGHAIAGDAVVDSDPIEALGHYRQSLHLVERSQVRAALVDLLIAEGQLTEARSVLAEGSNALPLQVRRMVVAQRAGRGDTMTAEINAADREFRRWIAEEDWLHAREMARFYLDVRARPALARRLALVNLSLQHEPEDYRLERRTREAVDHESTTSFCAYPCGDAVPRLTPQPLSFDVHVAELALRYQRGPVSWDLALFNPLDAFVLEDDQEGAVASFPLTEVVAFASVDPDLDPQIGAFIQVEW